MKSREDFEEAIAQTLTEGRRVLRDEGVACIVFAHKTTEGWEALLSGMIRAGWLIRASWPIATERPGRLRSLESAALATSVHLICRPRDDDAPIGDWVQVLGELPRRVGSWMDRLQREGVRGADLVFACIGPALEVFSRYSRVETAEGREIRLEEYLAKVWEVVGKEALGQVLGTHDAQGSYDAVGALEEDARLTALFLWTLQGTSTGRVEATLENGPEDVDGAENEDVDEEGESQETGNKPKKPGYRLAYDIVRRFSQPLGIRLDIWEGRIVETDKGVVRLLTLSDRAAHLFGGETAASVAAGAGQFHRGPVQAKLFSESEPRKGKAEDGRRPKKQARNPALSEMTTLDRVHSAMLLQTAGQSGALLEFLGDEIRRGPQFLRLANALSALYARKSEEKRLLDAVLLAVPRR